MSDLPNNVDLLRLRELLGEVHLNLLAAIDKIPASVAGWKDVDEADRLLYAAMIRLDRANNPTLRMHQ